MIYRQALNGLPLDDLFIFDVHGHYGKDTAMLQNDAFDGIVSTMDSVGVNAICLSANLAFESDNRLGNQLTLEAARKHPGRIYGYAVPTPWYDDLTDPEELILKNPEFLGIKIHSSIQKSSIQAPGYTCAYEIAHKHQLPLLFHAWGADQVKQITTLAGTYRDAQIILGHSGFTDYNTKLAAIEAIRRYDNVFVDTAISSTYEGALEWIVNQVGANRVLYGSDLPFFDCRHTLGKIALSRLSEADKLKILSKNALQIFRIPQIP